MLPSKSVSSDELRRLFNLGRYWERVQNGERYSVVLRERHPAPRESGQPPCTLSQILSYRDQTGNEVARVHQYKRPDGTLGGSGRPDPKRLVHDGILYRLQSRRPP